MPDTIKEIIAVHLDPRLTVDEVQSWSKPRKELFFLGLTLCRAAAHNVRVEWSDERIAALVDEFGNENP